MTRAHASHVSSYFKPTPANHCAILERGTAERAAFSPLAWSQRNLRLTPLFPWLNPAAVEIGNRTTQW
jgi:hypothetical protein